MNLPLVSVVIPAFNAEQFITKTLDSVKKQTYQNFELIVVNDGSTDETAKTAASFIKDNSIAGFVITQENKKIAAARNAGILAARGTLIALLDADDIWYHNKLSRVVDEFIHNADIGLVCHNEIVKRNGIQIRVVKNGPLTTDMYSTLLFNGNALSPSAAVIKKEVSLSIGGFCENPDFNTVEDYDIWMRLSRVTKCRFVDEYLSEYTLMETSASRNLLYHYANMEIMLKAHLDGLPNCKNGVMQQLLARRRLSIVYRAALTQLAKYNEESLMQKAYAMKMIKTYPLDIKNIIRFILWYFNKKHT